MPVREPHLHPWSKYWPAFELAAAFFLLCVCEWIAIHRMTIGQVPVTFEKLGLPLFLLVPAVFGLTGWLAIRRIAARGEASPRALLSMRTSLSVLLFMTYLTMMELL